MSTAEAASRRRFLLQLSSCLVAVSAPIGAWSASAVSDEQVRALAALCRQLTGVANDNDALTRQYCAVLVETLDKKQWDGLRTLARLSKAQQRAASLKPPLRDVAELALQLWISGMVGTGRVITYADAPVWSALTFTKPPGVCGGAFGYWAGPPA
jgi:hypothetical protein